MKGICSLLKKKVREGTTRRSWMMKREANFLAGRVVILGVDTVATGMFVCVCVRILSWVLARMFVCVYACFYIFS